MGNLLSNPLRVCIRNGTDDDIQAGPLTIITLEVAIAGNTFHQLYIISYQIVGVVRNGIQNVLSEGKIGASGFNDSNYIF